MSSRLRDLVGVAMALLRPMKAKTKAVRVNMVEFGWLIESEMKGRAAIYFVVVLWLSARGSRPC